MVVAEGVSTPEEVDRIWRLSTGTALGPFRLMDRIGLDFALAVEEHYATIRDGIPAAPRELLRDYVDKGFLGIKSGRGLLGQRIGERLVLGLVGLPVAPELTAEHGLVRVSNSMWCTNHRAELATLSYARWQPRPRTGSPPPSSPLWVSPPSVERSS